MDSKENNDSDEDIPTLSVETLAALEEFYKEQNSNKIEFKEDWQLSQFWYDNSTIEILVSGILNVVQNSGNIALLSCPSLYKRLKQDASNCEIRLFEYDRRFAMYAPDFIFYDYKTPLNVPRDLAKYFDLVIADPPFLSEDCLIKTAVTIKFLTKDKIVLCTGAVMENLVKRLLNLNKCIFEPQHENNLANEFWCYSNFDFDSMLNR